MKSIKLNKEIGDPEVVAIGTNARRHERGHLLGLLRIYIETMKKRGLTNEEVYESLDQWIKQRELTASGDASQ
ncbi:Uncharacterised protein [Klebsiella quasipneumoniae]|uniref:hypothetical protein n=1 Tax=Klebsiella quasipneumoniae TaxID=1463165 RepID=UPI0012538CB5|nr:hypothetical protein [Klebsiella quasipneumoniae]VAS54382.1 Uncharacterised protein [Klebsiella quasipneumoniae]